MFFGPNIHTHIRRILRGLVEGTYTQRHGLFIRITEFFLDKIEGRIRDTSGSAIYTVKFKALVFRVFPQEVVDVIVEDVNPVSPFSSCFYSIVQCRSVLSSKQCVSCRIGPAKVMIGLPVIFCFSCGSYAKQNIPSNFKYENSIFLSADQKWKISPGTILRVRIMNYNFRNGDYV